MGKHRQKSELVWLQDTNTALIWEGFNLYSLQVKDILQTLQYLRSVTDISQVKHASHSSKVEETNILKKLLPPLATPGLLIIKFGGAKTQRKKVFHILQIEYG